MTISSRKLRLLAMQRYPNARVYCLDKEYDIPTKRLIEKSYKGFQRWMWAMGFVKWIARKLDCDKWAWLYKAYCIIRHALSKKANALPIGFLCYNIDAETGNGHAINSPGFIAYDGAAFAIKELEPQPKGGIKTITEEERDTAWIIVF